MTKSLLLEQSDLTAIKELLSKAQYEQEKHIIWGELESTYFFDAPYASDHGRAYKLVERYQQCRHSSDLSSLNLNSLAIQQQIAIALKIIRGQENDLMTSPREVRLEAAMLKDQFYQQANTIANHNIKALSNIDNVHKYGVAAGGSIIADGLSLGPGIALGLGATWVMDQVAELKQNAVDTHTRLKQEGLSVADIKLYFHDVLENNYLDQVLCFDLSKEAQDYLFTEFAKSNSNPIVASKKEDNVTAAQQAGAGKQPDAISSTTQSCTMEELSELYKECQQEKIILKNQTRMMDESIKVARLSNKEKLFSAQTANKLTNAANVLQHYYQMRASDKYAKEELDDKIKHCQKHLSELDLQLDLHSIPHQSTNDIYLFLNKTLQLNIERKIASQEEFTNRYKQETAFLEEKIGRRKEVGEHCKTQIEELKKNLEYMMAKLKKIRMHHFGRDLTMMSQLLNCFAIDPASRTMLSLTSILSCSLDGIFNRRRQKKIQRLNGDLNEYTAVLEKYHNKYVLNQNQLDSFNNDLQNLVNQVIQSDALEPKELRNEIDKEITRLKENSLELDKLEKEILGKRAEAIAFKTAIEKKNKKDSRLPGNDQKIKEYDDQLAELIEHRKQNNIAKNDYDKHKVREDYLGQYKDWHYQNLKNLQEGDTSKLSESEKAEKEKLNHLHSLLLKQYHEYLELKSNSRRAILECFNSLRTGTMALSAMGFPRVNALLDLANQTYTLYQIYENCSEFIFGDPKKPNQSGILKLLRDNSSSLEEMINKMSWQLFLSMIVSPSITATGTCLAMVNCIGGLIHPRQDIVVEMLLRIRDEISSQLNTNFKQVFSEFKKIDVKVDNINTNVVQVINQLEHLHTDYLATALNTKSTISAGFENQTVDNYEREIRGKIDSITKTTIKLQVACIRPDLNLSSKIPSSIGSLKHYVEQATHDDWTGINFFKRANNHLFAQAPRNPMYYIGVIGHYLATVSELPKLPQTANLLMLQPIIKEVQILKLREGDDYSKAQLKLLLARLIESCESSHNFVRQLKNDPEIFVNIIKLLRLTYADLLRYSALYCKQNRRQSLKPNEATGLKDWYCKDQKEKYLLILPKKILSLSRKLIGYDKFFFNEKIPRETIYIGNDTKIVQAPRDFIIQCHPWVGKPIAKEYNSLTTNPEWVDKVIGKNYNQQTMFSINYYFSLLKAKLQQQPHSKITVPNNIDWNFLAESTVIYPRSKKLIALLLPKNYVETVSNNPQIKTLKEAAAKNHCFLDFIYDFCYVPEKKSYCLFLIIQIIDSTCTKKLDAIYLTMATFDQESVECFRKFSNTSGLPHLNEFLIMALSIDKKGRLPTQDTVIFFNPIGKFNTVCPVDHLFSGLYWLLKAFPAYSLAFNHTLYSTAKYKHLEHSISTQVISANVGHMLVEPSLELTAVYYDQLANLFEQQQTLDNSLFINLTKENDFIQLQVKIDNLYTIAIMIIKLITNFDYFLSLEYFQRNSNLLHPEQCKALLQGSFLNFQQEIIKSVCMVPADEQLRKDFDFHDKSCLLWDEFRNDFELLTQDLPPAVHRASHTSSASQQFYTTYDSSDITYFKEIKEHATPKNQTDFTNYPLNPKLPKPFFDFFRKPQQPLGYPLYRDDDISLLIQHKISDFGGFRKGCKFILNGIGEDAALPDEDNHRYIVAITEAVDTRGKSIPIDGFLDKTRLPTPVAQDDRVDVFDEIRYLFNGLQNFRLKILFPYNRDDVHWLGGEIIIIRQDSNNYQVELLAHDPFGGGELSKENYLTLIATIEKKIKELDSIATVVFKNSRSNYHARQSRSDNNSCGVIIVEDILKRIVGGSLNIAQPHPPGAPALRLAHYKFIQEKLPQNNQSRADFLRRNNLIANEDIRPILNQ